jgi:hypothetical protein
MNPSNRTSVPLLRVVLWIAIGLVVVVVGACEALSPSTKPRHLEIAPDRPVHPLPMPVGPEPPEAELVA